MSNEAEVQKQEEQGHSLVMDVEELDVWIRGFWERLGSLVSDPAICGEIERHFVTEISHVIVHCLTNNASHTFTTDFDAAGRATKTTCRFSIDRDNLCYDLALAGFKAGATMKIIS